MKDSTIIKEMKDTDAPQKKKIKIRTWYKIEQRKYELSKFAMLPQLYPATKTHLHKIFNQSSKKFSGHSSTIEDKLRGKEEQ